MHKLLYNKVRNKGLIEIASQMQYTSVVHAMSIASRHIKQPIVFQIQEDLEDVS